MIKPVSFRPSLIDDALINKLKEEKGIDVTSDLIRAAIQHYAAVSLDPSVYSETVLNAYEKDVTGS